MDIVNNYESRALGERMVGMSAMHSDTYTLAPKRTSDI